MLNGGILTLLEADPSFNFWTSRVMEVNNTDKRGERNRRSYCRHLAVSRGLRRIVGSNSG